ncbi:hypothetical protein JIR23_06810 [Bradyrhizobium diazoefficiens]|nr:hypothetical protein [Bradyrhizobium diazoefficiens]QQN65457.1 hypothetical protein JIR23_06810 [Bradyrhizobium diazoefficiens]
MWHLSNTALGDLSGEFGELYTNFDRPLIAPQKLHQATLPQAFHGFVRSGI